MPPSAAAVVQCHCAPPCGATRRLSQPAAPPRLTRRRRPESRRFRTCGRQARASLGRGPGHARPLPGRNWSDRAYGFFRRGSDASTRSGEQAGRCYDGRVITINPFGGFIRTTEVERYACPRSTSHERCRTASQASDCEGVRDARRRRPRRPSGTGRRRRPLFSTDRSRLARCVAGGSSDDAAAGRPVVRVPRARLPRAACRRSRPCGWALGHGSHGHPRHRTRLPPTGDHRRHVDPRPSNGAPTSHAIAIGTAASMPSQMTVTRPSIYPSAPARSPQP